MGCASSSPLVNGGGGPGGLVETAKSAANDVMTTGENAMSEMTENITETVGQVKETVVETVNGMKNTIGDVISDGMTKIPLKDTMDNSNHLLEENLENLKNEMMSKAQSVSDETDKITDELIKDTEDVIRDAETGMVDMKNSAEDTIESMKNELMESVNMSSPSHSIETIQTSVAEPEIEKLLNGDDSPASPEATVNELENLSKENELEPTAPAEQIKENKPEESMPPETLPKLEEELVVEDVKDEQPANVEKFGRFLKRNSTIQELSESSEESGESEDEESEPHVDEFSIPKEVKPSIEEIDFKSASWMEKQELFLQQQLQRRTPSVESIESMKKNSDTESLDLNLENLYDSPSKKSQKKTQKDLDVMDEFIKEVDVDSEALMEN